MLRYGDRLRYCGSGVREHFNCGVSRTPQTRGMEVLLFLLSVLLVEKVIALAGVKLLILWLFLLSGVHLRVMT